MEVREEAGGPGLPADFIPLRLVLKASGTVVDLTRPDMVLGRHSAADVRLPLPDVSRRHCRFYFEEGAWHVEDLKSLNGTYVNEQAVEQALVCHGDTLRIGAVPFEVSQPRQPCWKLARRWRMHELTGLVVRNGRSGWYLRVLEEGWIEASMPVILLDRPNPDWPIARANEVLHHRKTDAPLALQLADVPQLAGSWSRELRERATTLASALEAPRRA